MSTKSRRTVGLIIALAWICSMAAIGLYVSLTDGGLEPAAMPVVAAMCFEVACLALVWRVPRLWIACLVGVAGIFISMEPTVLTLAEHLSNVIPSLVLISPLLIGSILLRSTKAPVQ